ncbi:bifunctional adenosylcobinamide kinase/adenosylcobinamide-phosphate guanylyltransferase [Chitinispirillales bacterium ANBcel5]|uniref:bifunctional adenosylcobinamide kinase/adenosylcobinamide-phosphate guanylyltransferase n=1 Tax=Cellulosispirillum alkaliphilum TaxID=3039283 RepID=UPI002A5243B4|nr:bifunctional adenosylcobinamide kinase/adenosylcobinamide-phosphate guanylyltransferase [Chitinispirillales bacterium ANBcel5]
MGKFVLITGGVRSGKSAWALKRANESPSKSKVFIATAECFDEEMKERVTNHKLERGDEWVTVEEPYKIDRAVGDLDNCSAAVIDCCTVWLGNIWYKNGDSDTALVKNIENFSKSLLKWQQSEGTGEIVIVSNEVGWGIVPLEKSVRRYRDWAGKLNQKIASLADEVYLCVAGISVKIK